MCRAIFIYLFQIRLFYYRADLLMFYFIKLATVIEPFYYLFIYLFMHFLMHFFLGYNIFVIFVSFRNIYFIIIIIVIFLISKFEFLYTYFI